MAESIPGGHYTLVRSPSYYRASEGLPYLDKVVFRNAPHDTLLQDLQAGLVDSACCLELSQVQEYRRLTHYTLVTKPYQRFRSDVFQLPQPGLSHPSGSATGNGEGHRSPSLTQ